MAVQLLIDREMRPIVHERTQQLVMTRALLVNAGDKCVDDAQRRPTPNPLSGN